MNLFENTINPVGKIHEKVACRSVILTIMALYLSAELTKTHSFRLSFISNYLYLMLMKKKTFSSKYKNNY